RMERWAASRPGLEAAEEFGQAPQVHVGGGVEHAFEQLLDLDLMAIAGKAERDQSVVMRPDRAVVIRHRIVARLAPGNGADAPSREELRGQQHRGDLASMLRPCDAAEQDLPGIGAAHQARRLGAIERKRVGAEIVGPEACLELRGELDGLRLELTRVLAAPDLRSTARQRLFRRVDVALHLGKRDWSFRQAAIRVENGVEGILPALVDEPAYGGAMIFDEAV